MAITESLGELPKNKRILLEREMELERRLLIKEAREEIWKKWRQNKGRKNTNPKIKTKEDKNPMEEKLKKVELEVAKFKDEREKKKQEEEKQKQSNRPEDEESKKKRRLATKKRLERYWEKLRWVTRILEETEDIQANIRKLRDKDSKEEEEGRSWNQMSETEKMKTVREEDIMKEKQKDGTGENRGKEERLKEALRVKRSWEEDEEGKMEKEEEEADVEAEDFLGQGEPTLFCLACCMTPCICMVRDLEKKIELLKLRREIEALEDQVETMAWTRERKEQEKKGRKRRLDLEEEEVEEAGTPRKKTKPEKLKNARINQQEVQQQSFHQREGSSAAVQEVQSPHLHPGCEDEDPALKVLKTPPKIPKLKPELKGVQPPPHPGGGGEAVHQLKEQPRPHQLVGGGETALLRQPYWRSTETCQGEVPWRGLLKPSRLQRGAEAAAPNVEPPKQEKSSSKSTPPPPPSQPPTQSTNQHREAKKIEPTEPSRTSRPRPPPTWWSGKSRSEKSLNPSLPPPSKWEENKENITPHPSRITEPTPSSTPSKADRHQPLSAGGSSSMISSRKQPPPSLNPSLTTTLPITHSLRYRAAAKKLKPAEITCSLPTPGGQGDNQEYHEHHGSQDKEKQQLNHFTSLPTPPRPPHYGTSNYNIT